MGVGVQGEACGEVTEHTADCLDVHATLQCNGRKGVAEIMKSDLWNACPCQHPLEHVVYTVR